MVARMRVATSGTIAWADDYGNSTPTAGLVLTSLGPGNPPDWAPGTAAVRPINHVLIVDAVNGVAAATGTWASPFLTIPAAIAYAVTQGWSDVQLLIASAVYAADFVVPIAMSVTLSGYDPTGSTVPTISGDITFSGAGFATLDASNVFFSGNTIDIGAQSLQSRFTNCVNACDITGANGSTLDLEWIETEQTGNVTAVGGIIQTYWDGWSWAMTMQSFPAFLDDTTYAREFRDAGHSVIAANATVNGVAIGTTAFVQIPTPTFVRADDRADVQLANPATQDFICGVHGVANAIVTLWLTNLSRVSTNFDDAVLLLIHHDTMTTEPVP